MAFLNSNEPNNLVDLRMIGKRILHYNILSKLGEGGMGVVYLAGDTRLQRKVAIKFLPPHIADDPAARENIVHEARTAAALNHPSIATIHAIEEDAGHICIVMEYIDGQVLKDRLRAMPMSIEEVFDVTVKIAEGLQEAHSKGIIHRDIKPSNIMCTENGQVKITDFGLAMVDTEKKRPPDDSLMGTTPYLSPEQVRGTTIDHRSDIWSFGVVLYEMLTGEMPFIADYPPAVLYAILNETPQPATNFRDNIPESLQNVCEKALAKNPEERYQSMSELLQDLHPQGGINSPREKISIGVLPFKNICPVTNNNYFSDGLTEEIITELANVPDLRVISRLSARGFEQNGKDIKNTARELRVQYLLEGSVRVEGNHLRITAQLTNVVTDTYLWAVKYCIVSKEEFIIQETLAQAIVDRLLQEVLPEENGASCMVLKAYNQGRDEYDGINARLPELPVDGLEIMLKSIRNDLNCPSERAR